MAIQLKTCKVYAQTGPTWKCHLTRQASPFAKESRINSWRELPWAYQRFLRFIGILDRLDMTRYAALVRDYLDNEITREGISLNCQNSLQHCGKRLKIPKWSGSGVRQTRTSMVFTYREPTTLLRRLLDEEDVDEVMVEVEEEPSVIISLHQLILWSRPALCAGLLSRRE